MATAYDIIIRPIITERAMAGAADKKYVFEVAKDAGKIEIKKAVEEIFGVKVASVNTLTVPGKEKRMGAGRPGSDTPVQKGNSVAVIGGGNTAMDSCRTARRMGAERVMIIYRRSMDEMPARAEEIEHAKEEGVEFLTLCNPVRYEGDERGHVTKMFVQRMELGEPDASGRRKPVPIEGAIDEIDVDQVIVSVGVSPNPLIPNNIEGLNSTERGTIAVDENHQSSIPTIFAGGDIVRGGATVILAMGDGRQAAAAMAKKLLEEA